MKAFLVEKEEDGKYVVVDQDGRTHLKCGPDRHSAEHYAALMNACWKAGHRQGYKEGREASK